jgi:hypothetical protein
MKMMRQSAGLVGASVRRALDQEVFKKKLPVLPRERVTAAPAVYLAIACCGSASTRTTSYKEHRNSGNRNALPEI